MGISMATIAAPRACPNLSAELGLSFEDLFCGCFLQLREAIILQAKNSSCQLITGKDVRLVPLVDKYAGFLQDVSHHILYGANLDRFL